MKTSKLLFVAVLVMGLAPAARAGVIAASPSAPSTTSPDITNFVNNGVDGNDYSDRFPGQTFTTGSDPSGYLLDGVTVQGEAGNAGNGYQSANFYLAIYSVSGSNLTNIGNETFTWPGGADYSSDYLTLNLTTPVTLAAGTEYAFAFFNYPGSGYYGFADSVNSDTYAGGTAISLNEPASPGADTTIAAAYGYDKSFAVDLAVAPEPSTWAMMFGGGAVLFGMLRFRRRTL